MQKANLDSASKKFLCELCMYQKQTKSHQIGVRQNVTVGGGDVTAIDPRACVAFARIFSLFAMVTSVARDSAGSHGAG
jgi:hypothetical protein